MNLITFLSSLRGYALFGAISVAGAGVFLLWGMPSLFSVIPAAEKTIILTEQGFIPSELTIQEGERVRFITKRSIPFWPASNLHPSHDIYSEFDPKQPIVPDQEWSFRFAKTGEWRYHDHLAPGFEGIIRVTNQVRKKDQEDTELSYRCEGRENEIQSSCWEKHLTALAEEQGFNAAFSLFSQLYEANPLFRRYCHDYVHSLGKLAYRFFESGRPIDLASNTAYCSFGFYHGFMESLVSESGDFKKARAFCSYVKETLSTTLPSAAKPCFHGIGHGWAAVHRDDDLGERDERAWVNPALEICEKTAETDEELFLCATGVFDSLAIDYYNEDYGFSMKKDDPLWICHRQPERYKKSCYKEMTTAVIWLGGHDLIRSISIARRHVEPDYLLISIKTLAENSVRFLKERTLYAPSLNACRSLEKEYKIPCIFGLASGYVQFGPPGKEYADGFAFCASPLLASKEKHACYESVLGYAAYLYSHEKFISVCNEAEKPYQEICSSIR